MANLWFIHGQWMPAVNPPFTILPRATVGNIFEARGCSAPRLLVDHGSTATIITASGMGKLGYQSYVRPAWGTAVDPILIRIVDHLCGWCLFGKLSTNRYMIIMNTHQNCKYTNTRQVIVFGSRTSLNGK